MSQVWMSKRSAYRALFLFIVTLFAIDTFAQDAAPGVPEAPDGYTFSERDSRERFDSGGNLIFPNFEYSPGYFFRNGAFEDDDDYDSQTVFRIEYGVENDGTTRSKIKETKTFTIGGNIYNGLVRDFRAGVVAEPYDDIVVVRLLDDVDPDPETPLSNTNFPGYDGPLADLCTGTLPGSNATCSDNGLPTHKNRNSFFHQYTDGPAGGSAPPLFSDTSTECDQAYNDLLGIPSPGNCPVVRFQSERVRCFKCVSNAFAINRGTDNTFSKDAGRTRNNIGRLDLILDNPIVITQQQASDFADANSGDNLLENIGFLLMERGGNDHYAVAAIREIKNIDALLDGTDTATADNLNVTELQNFARLLRTYDNLPFESPGTAPFDDRPQLIAEDRSATSLVTQLGPLLNTLEKTEGGAIPGGLGDIWGSTSENIFTTVIMSSEAEVGNADHFYENRPDQNLSAQSPNGSFITLADLGFDFGDLAVDGDGELLKDGNVEFFGVSQFAADVRTDTAVDYDLITLTNIPRDTTAASGFGGLDFTGGGGFFSRDDTPLLAPQLSLAKALTGQSSNPIVEGTTLTYTITATNTGDVALTNMVVTDALITPTGGTTPCASVAVGGTCTLIGTYVVTAADVTAGQVVNTGTADSDETPPVNDEVTTPVFDPQLSVAKALTGQSSDPIVEGTTLTYTITATNTGDVALTNVVVTDALITPTGGTTPCASVAVGGTCTLIGTYVVTAADVTAGQVVNTGTADSDETPPAVVELTTPVFDPQLSVAKALTGQSSDPIVEGTTLTYTITATNTGDVALTNMVLTDALITPTGGTTPCASVAVGGTCTLIGTYVVTAADVTAGQVVNTGTADSDETPPVNDEVTTPVFDPQLSVAKALTGQSSDPIVEGTTLTYTITATNTGDVALTNVVVTDALITPTGGTTPCASVAVGGTCTLIGTYVVTAADVTAGQVVNTGTADSDETPPAVVELTTPVFDPQLSVAKALTGQSSDPIVEGTTLTYTITATNTGDVALTNMVLTDALITPTGGTTPCASVAVGGTCTLIGTYVVTAADVTAGQVVNTGTADSDETPPVNDEVTTPVFDPQLSVAKALTGQSSDPIVEGTTLTYTITATNTGDVALTNVVLTDALITPTGGTTPCASVAVGGTCTLIGTYVVTAADVTAGQVVNTGTADSDETPPVNDEVTTPVFDPQLSVAKALTGQSSNPIVEGTTLTYTITATNTGDVALTNVVVTDDLITPTGGTTPCASVAVGGTCTLIGTYVVTAADVTAGQVVNTGTADSDETPPAVVELTTPVFEPQLSVAKALTGQSSNPIVEGTTLTYTITATNTGDVALTNVVVTDDLITPTGGTTPCASVAVGGTCTLIGTYVVTAADVTAGQVVNTGTADSDETPPAVVELTTPVFEPQLSVAKALTGQSSDPIVEGTTLTYTITATNTGDVALTNVVVTDALITPTGGTTPCASVAVGGTCTLIGTYVVTAADVTAGQVVNTGTADSDETPPAVVELTTPVFAPQLSVAKALTNETGGSIAGVAEPGETLTYTITLTNSGGADATGVDITDDIDANTTFVSASAGGSFAAGVVTWTGLTVPANDSLALVVEVTVNDPIPADVTQIVNLVFETGTPPPECPDPRCVETPTPLQVTFDAIPVPSLTAMSTTLLAMFLLLVGLGILRYRQMKP